MREPRALGCLATVFVAVAALIVLALVFIPRALSGLDPSDPAKARPARPEIAQRVDAFAGQVVAASTAVSGPAPAELATLSRNGGVGNRVTIDYVDQRIGSALGLLWIRGHVRVGSPLDSVDVADCYSVGFHDLGSAHGASQVTHLPDCRAVDQRLQAERLRQLPGPTS